MPDLPSQPDRIAADPPPQPARRIAADLPAQPARRIAAALAVVLATLAVWAVGLPRPIYIGAMLLGGGLAVLLVAGIPRGPLVPTLALVCVGMSLALALGDLVLRSALASRLFPRPSEILSRRWPTNPELSRYRPNAHYEGPMFGDLAAMTGRVEDREERAIVFHTDARGFRNPPPLPEGPLDAILLADSFGAATSTSDGETWLGYLRDAWGLRTYSLSAPGSPWSELLALKTEIGSLALRPGTTLLWALFTGNDLEDRYRDSLDVPRPNGPLERASIRFDAFRHRSPLRLLWKGAFGSSLHVERAAHDPSFLYLRDYAERSRRSADEVEAHDSFPRLARVFASMRELAGQHPLRVVVVSIPTKWETYAWLLDPSREAESTQPSGFAVAVERLCRREGFGFVDLKPALVEEARRAWQDGEYVFWRDDTHWNGRGQRVAARVVAPLVASPERGAIALPAQ